MFFLILCFYAFVDPARDWMQINIGPPVLAIFGGIIIAITTSPIWLQYVAPTLNAWLIGLGLGIVPVSFPLIHRAFNAYRGRWVRSADKESGRTVEIRGSSSTPAGATVRPETTSTPATEVVIQPPPTPPTQEKKEGESSA